MIFDLFRVLFVWLFCIDSNEQKIFILFYSLAYVWMWPPVVMMIASTKNKSIDKMFDSLQLNTFRFKQNRKQKQHLQQKVFVFFFWSLK